MSFQLFPEGRDLLWDITDPEGTFDSVTWIPTEARGIRLYPQSFHQAACIRLELFGCTLSKLHWIYTFSDNTSLYVPILPNVFFLILDCVTLSRVNDLLVLGSIRKMPPSTNKITNILMMSPIQPTVGDAKAK